MGDIHYFAHWITPRGAPRRYDTRFFVAAAPPGQIAAHDAGETIAEVWISPHDALARHRAGEIDIIFPTIRNLQVIGRFDTSRALLGAAEEASSAVPAIEPRVVPDGNGMRIVLPGDPGYERGAVPDTTDGSARGDFNEAVREVSMRANQEGPGHGARPATRRPVIPAVPDCGVGPAPVPGRIDEVAPGVRRLTAPNPGLMTGPGTNTYLVGRAELAVVDPGPDDEAHTKAILGAAAPLGPIRTILVTHTHVDHAPGAGRARRCHRCSGGRLRALRRVHAGRACRGGMDPVVPGSDPRCGSHAAGTAHTWPRVGSPVLAGRGARALVHGRPRDARVHGGDPTAGR